MKTMTVRERFNAVMNFQPFDRLPIIEWAGWWDKTLDRWHNESLPVTYSGSEVFTYLGMDTHYQDWFNPIQSNFSQSKDSTGIIIKDMEDYERLKESLYPCPAIDHGKWEKWTEKQKKGEIVIWFTLEGFFWFPRRLLGVEGHLYAFFDKPEIIHRINEDLSDYHLKIIDEICAAYTPDFMTFAEDMSYNKGPMISKNLFDNFMKPYYNKVIPRLKEHDIKVVIDSDGDISEPAYWFEETGIDGILPLERQAGTDIKKLRKEHPRQLYIGAFDKMVMDQGEEAVRAEFERLLPVAKQGGFIISVDHQTPPQVSLEQYKQYLRLFREYAEKAAQ